MRITPQVVVLLGLVLLASSQNSVADFPPEPGNHWTGESDGRTPGKSWLQAAARAMEHDESVTDHFAAFDFESAARDVPKPREIWPIVKQHTVPLEFKVLCDEIVTSDTDPSQRLRKVTAHFWSQELAGKKWGHPCVLFLPEDDSRNSTAERKGKVVIIGSPPYGYYPVHIAKYGEPIAARTGYPTLVLSNPGEYSDGTAIEGDIRILNRLREKTGKNVYNMNGGVRIQFATEVDRRTGC